MSRQAVLGKKNFGLFVYHGKRKVTYYVRREMSGKGVLDKKLKASNENDARREMQSAVAEWLGMKPKKAEVLLIDELWDEFEQVKSDKSEATIYSIKNSGKHLMPFFKNCLPSEVTPMLWERYIMKKRSEDKDRRFFNDWKWFGMFLKYLHENGLIERKPRLRNPDPKSEVGRVLSEDEIMRLLVHSNTPGLHVQIIMSATMGTRDGENKCLYWQPEYGGKKRSFIDLHKRSITLLAEDTKIRKGRTFPISPEALEELRYLKKSAKGACVFASTENPNERAHRQSTKGAWRRCRDNANVKCRFHDLRHTYLTNAFNAAKGKIDSMLICEAAGLSIEEAQSTYLHFSLDDMRPVSTLVSLNFLGKSRKKRGKS